MGVVEPGMYSTLTLGSPGKPTHIFIATTTQAETGRSLLERVTINATHAGGTISIYDNVGGDTTNPIAVLPASAAVGTYEYGARMANGIKIVTSAAWAGDITVMTEPLP